MLHSYWNKDKKNTDVVEWKDVTYSYYIYIIYIYIIIYYLYK
jgi:hypothetical protein